MSKTELLASMGQRVRELDEEIGQRTKEKQVIVDAIAAMDGRLAGRAPRTRTKPVTRRRRHGPEWYETQVLDYLRQHPAASFSAVDIYEDLRIPSNSTREAVERLVSHAKVTKVDVTPKGKSIVQHKPVSIRPGDPVPQ